MVGTLSAQTESNIWESLLFYDIFGKIKLKTFKL